MALPQDSEYLIALTHLRIVTYFRVASTTAYVYDYLLTFPREVSLIWPSAWTVIKILFLFTRYIPFVDRAFLLYYHFQQHQTDKTCSALYKIISWLFYIGKGLPEIILTLRTLAVWNRDRRLSIGLAIIFVACFLPITGIIFVFLESVEVTLLTSPVLLGCVLTNESHIISIAWIMILIYQTVLFSLMLIQGIRCYRHGLSSRMFQVVFRDGLLYYIYLFAVSLINIVVSASVTPTLHTFFVSIDRVVLAIIGCRVVLDIRGHMSDGGPGTRSFFLASLDTPPPDRNSQAPTLAQSL